MTEQKNTYGPNGMNGTLYKDSWDIIGDDIHKMVLHFFSGAELPRFATHTKFGSAY